jgi:hypothetical protein
MDIFKSYGLTTILSCSWIKYSSLSTGLRSSGKITIMSLCLVVLVRGPLNLEQGVVSSNLNQGNVNQAESEKQVKIRSTLRCRWWKIWLPPHYEMMRAATKTYHNKLDDGMNTEELSTWTLPEYARTLKRGIRAHRKIEHSLVRPIFIENCYWKCFRIEV